MNPKVSILIPCFNAAPWVGQAIESALEQSWPTKEVIVVDDGSTDASLDEIRRFEGRIRFESGANRGGNSARNRLLSLSTGEWLQYLDADDYLLPNKVADQMACTQNCDVVFSRVYWEYCLEDNRTEKVVFEIPDEQDVLILLALWLLPQTGGVLLRRSALEDVGGWKVDQPCCQEHELYLRMIQRGKIFKYCDGIGAVYRQWGSHTVCKRDLPETHRRRLEIEENLLRHLDHTQELTLRRLHAINQARFETARSVWQYDRQAAVNIMESVAKSEPSFTPGGAAAPRLYKLAFKAFGFARAEDLAEKKRSWLGKTKLWR